LKPPVRYTRNTCKTRNITMRLAVHRCIDRMIHPFVTHLARSRRSSPLQ
jgi:hypothetical protein